MNQPRPSDIAAAKEYLRRRVAAEVGMEHYLDRKLLAAARRLVRLAYKRNIPPTFFSFQYDAFLAMEAALIINSLLDEIEEYNIRLATSTNRDSSTNLIPYINREVGGNTYHERLRLYTNRFKDEVQHFIKVGLLTGLSSTALSNLIARDYKHPQQSSLFFDREHKGFSAYPRLLLLTRHTIADAWMHADMEYHLRRGAIGFITYRGSNYPCDTCADYAGRFHTFAEPYPPLHPSCKCYAVPIYQP